MKRSKFINRCMDCRYHILVSILHNVATCEKKRMNCRMVWKKQNGKCNSFTNFETLVPRGSKLFTKERGW